MKRREAIEKLGWGLSGGILIPSLLAQCAKKDPGPEISYDGTVGVIGAGASGLYVADILRSKGIKVKVFEARDQIGGRIRSLRNQPESLYPAMPYLGSDFPLELGAQTVLGSDSIMGKIFQVYNLLTTEFAPSTNQFVLDNMPKFDTDWSGDSDYIAAKNFRANLKTHVGSGQTVQQAIQSAGLSTRTYGMLNGQIGNAYGGSNDIVGIGELAQEETIRKNDGKIITLKSNPLQDVLISRFNEVQSLINLNTPIASVNYGGDKVSLTGKDGTAYEVDKVIVTVPISILKSGGLTFSPGLPGSFTSSMAKLGMGASMRIIVEFKKNFWGDSIGYILGSANVPEYLSVGLGRSQFNATLSITVNGAKAAQYSAMGESAVDAILDDIDLLYPNPPGSLFTGLGTQFVRKVVDTTTNQETDQNIYILHDWTKTEYISGGYSYPLAGAVNDDRKNIGLPIGAKVFFAGEATDVSGQAGNVNGALASAERAAQDVINSIMNP